MGYQCWQCYDSSLFCRISHCGVSVANSIDWPPSHSSDSPSVAPLHSITASLYRPPFITTRHPGTSPVSTMAWWVVRGTTAVVSVAVTTWRSSVIHHYLASCPSLSTLLLYSLCAFVVPTFDSRLPVPAHFLSSHPLVLPPRSVMADPLSSSLLDAHEERKGGTTYSLYAEPSTEPSLFKRFFSSRRHLVIFAAVSLIVALAIIIPFVASAAGKGEPVFPSTDSSSSTGTSPPPDMTSSAAALSSAMPSSDPSSSSSFDLSSSAQSSSALSSSAQSSSAVSSSALSSSAQSSSASAMWSSSSSVAPIYTVNRTIAGMFVTQHGQGDRVVIVMPNVFGIGANLWNLSLSYAMAGYRSYAVDTVYGGQHTQHRTPHSQDTSHSLVPPLPSVSPPPHLSLPS